MQKTGDMALVPKIIVHAERRNWTELNWTDSLVFDELASGQAVMHYSRHYLTASVACKTTLTYASTNDQWARLACPLVSL